MTEHKTTLTDQYGVEFVSDTELITSFGTPTKEPNYLAKQDLFVKNGTVYIQDTFKNKSKIKITAFIRSIKQAIDAALKFANGSDGFIDKFVVPTNWKAQPMVPKLSISVNCPDTEIDERAKQILDIIHSLLRWCILHHLLKQRIIHRVDE